MKSRLYIYVILILMVLSSCSKKMGQDGGYIKFTTQILTKSQMVSDMGGKSFGVFGYQYSGDWSTVQAQITPNLFNDGASPAIVSCDESGICTYSPMAKWSLGYKYSFFAYYPTSGVIVSDASREGTPTLKYTLPSREDATLLEDVLTSVVYDTDNSTSGSVNFLFKHRLFAIDVVGVNFNEDVEIYLDDIWIEFDNLKYDDVTFSLDANGESPIISRTSAENQGARYQLCPQGNVNEERVYLDMMSNNTVESKSVGDPVILIPQEGGISGRIYFDYRYKKNSSEEWSVEEGKEVSFTSDDDCLSGIKYSVTLNFSEDIIIVNVSRVGEWSEAPDTEIEFE